MTHKSNIQHPEDLPSDTKCTHSHTGQFFNLPIYFWILWGGPQWLSNLDICLMIVSNGKTDASHYRSVNREAFVCIAHSEVNVHRQNYCLISSGSVERKTCVGGEAFQCCSCEICANPSFLSPLQEGCSQAGEGVLQLHGSWSMLGSELSINFCVVEVPRSSPESRTLCSRSRQWKGHVCPTQFSLRVRECQQLQDHAQAGREKWAITLSSSASAPAQPLLVHHPSQHGLCADTGEGMTFKITISPGLSHDGWRQLFHSYTSPV